MWDLAKAGVPVAAILLPPTGYVVRLIAFSGEPWIPLEVAGYSPLSDLAVIGFFSIIGGAWGLVVFFTLVSRRMGSEMAPFVYFSDAWRGYGPTKQNRARARTLFANALSKVHHAWIRPRTFKRLIGDIQFAADRVRDYLGRQGWIRHAVKRAVLAVLRLAVAVLTVGLAVYWATILFQVTVGAPLGSAIQAVAAYGSLWHLRRLSARGVPLTLGTTAPTVLFFMASCAIGSGLNPTFASRPAEYSFAAHSRLAAGMYQQIGENAGIIYLVFCGPPVERSVKGVPLAQVEVFQILPSFKPTPRNSIQAAITGSLDTRYRPCD